MCRSVVAAALPLGLALVPACQQGAAGPQAAPMASVLPPSAIVSGAESPADAAPPPAPPPPPQPVKLKVTIVSATIDPRQSDGKKWDEGPAPKARTAGLSGPFAAWFRSHPELDGTEEVVGEPVLAPGVLEDARNSDSPDPVAFVEVAGKVFRTALVARSFQPAWGSSFYLQVLPASEDLVRITVCDWIMMAGVSAKMAHAHVRVDALVVE